MRSLSYLPNLLSSLRITLAPGMLGAAYSNSKTGFIILLCFAILTDAVDGWLARRLKAESDMGRRLDRWGNALTVSLGALGIYFLWPAEIESEWQATLLALAGYFVVGVDRLWLRPDRESRPSWCDWLFVLLLPVSLVLLIIEWSPWPFRIGAILQALIALRAVTSGEVVAGPVETATTVSSTLGAESPAATDVSAATAERGER